MVTVKGSEPGRLSQREIEELQRQDDVFDRVGAYYLSQYNVTGDGPPEAVPCAIGTSKVFEVLGSRFALGGPYAAREDFIRQYRVVLTYDFWQRRYSGDPNIVGSSITLDGGSYVIDGVLEKGSMFPPNVELYRQVTEYHGLDGRRHSMIARLKSGTSLEQAQQYLNRFGLDQEASFPELNRGVSFEVVSLRDSWIGDARPYLLSLAVAVVFVLMIAVFNTAHLLLAKAAEQRADMAVRGFLGAERGQLVRRQLMESLVPTFIGGALGVVLAFGSIRWLTLALQAQLPPWMEIRIDPPVLVAALFLTLFSGLLAGLIPALNTSRHGIHESLRARGSTDRGSVRFRNALMVAEIAPALVLLTGAGLMVRSFWALDRQDLGFDAEELLTVRVDPPYWTYNEVEHMTPFFDKASLELAKIPGIRGVAANQNLPLSGLDGNTKRVITLEGQSVQNQENNPFVHLQSIGRDYFEVMDIPLLQGRAFGTEDRQGGQPVAIVGKSLAERLWPSSDALGQRLKLGPPDSDTPWLTVVGQVGDVRSLSRSGAASLDLYISNLQLFTGDTYFALRTSREGAALHREVAEAIRRVDGDLPVFDVAQMEERIARVEWQHQATGRLFALFGLLALALAAFGIYGVMSHHVSQRTRELGIRQAFGATPRDLVSEVIRHGLSLFLFGTVLGGIAALGLARLIGHLLYGVEATDPWSTGVAWLVLLTTLVLACWLPARRAARLDPLLAIRGDG